MWQAEINERQSTMKLQLSNELGGMRFLFLTGPISRSHHMTPIVLAENYEKPREREREREREKGGEREKEIGPYFLDQE